MEIYLAGDNYKKQIMELFVAGLSNEENRKNMVNPLSKRISILESFCNMEDWEIPYIQNHWNFLLDSGAFTFLNSKKQNKINWDEYVEKYAEFINKYDIKLFFELDIDYLIGLKEVERLREKLHKLTNKQSISVWHKSRGKDYYIRMVQEFDYVAIGGLAIGGIHFQKQIEPVFPWFIKNAHKNNCKIHALGYTSIEGIKKFGFDSIDSSSWMYGNIGGYLYKFNGEKIIQIKKPIDKRIKPFEVAYHNFFEWVKFQQYARVNL